MRRRPSLPIRWMPRCRGLLSAKACEEGTHSTRIELRPLFAFPNQLVGLKVLDSERIEVLDGNNRMGKPQYSVEQADQANLISRFAEDLAKRKINPRSNPNLHRHQLSIQQAIPILKIME